MTDKILTQPIETTYEVKYFKCNKNHKHLTYNAAQKCIDKFDITKRQIEFKKIRDDIDIIINLRDVEKLTFTEIGKKYAVSPNRARQKYIEAFRKKSMYSRMAFDGLSNNLKNVIHDIVDCNVWETDDKDIAKHLAKLKCNVVLRQPNLGKTKFYLLECFLKKYNLEFAK
jgi:hypothetical protein